MASLIAVWFADAPEMAELGLVEPLGNILSQLSQGGGAKGINIDAVRPPPSDCMCHALPVALNKHRSDTLRQRAASTAVQHDSCFWHHAAQLSRQAWYNP